MASLGEDFSLCKGEHFPKNLCFVCFFNQAGRVLHYPSKMLKSQFAPSSETFIYAGTRTTLAKPLYQRREEAVS